jgi:hypothetical protein
VTGWIDGVAVLVWNCFAWVIWGAAIVEVVRTPAARFVRGWRTKVGRLAVIVMLSGVVGGLYLPLGAAVVLAGLRRTRPPDQPLDATPPLPRHPGGFPPLEDS